MYSFIVLGLIPGTNIQITFSTWIALLVSAVPSYYIVKFWLRYRIFLGQSVRVRIPLHATQLHYRG
jgi:hypothetical protein